MAISNCLFSPTSENPHGFSVWCVLAKLSAKPRNYSQPRPLPTIMLNEKECPREDRLLAIHCLFPFEQLPKREAIEKMVKGKKGINIEVIQNYLNWKPKDNQLIVYTGYGYCDLTVPKNYNYLINVQHLNKSKPVNSEVVFAIWNGWLPLETVEHGHKTICVIEFQDGIPDELTGLTEFDKWSKSTTNLDFGLCNEKDAELITTKLRTGG